MPGPTAIRRSCLITDGDDQQSYPLEAAAVAAERHVTIFTVGLGDADSRGADSAGGRRPSRTSSTRASRCGASWTARCSRKSRSRLPASTSRSGPRAYDLGELYANYLQGRRGGDEREPEADPPRGSVPDFPRARAPGPAGRSVHAALPRREAPEGRARECAAPSRGGARSGRSPSPHLPCRDGARCCASCCRAQSGGQSGASGARGLAAGMARAISPRRGTKFAAAREQFDKSDAAKSAIAAFDQACASHRKGDVAQAREWYLKAGLAHDKATRRRSAHFNLGTLAARGSAPAGGRASRRTSRPRSGRKSSTS